MNIKRSVVRLLFFLLAAHVQGQVPQIIHYQGRIVVSGTNYDGAGLFKFALMDGSGGQTLWSNGVDTVVVPVTKGLYSVMLGDSGMMPLSINIFTYSNVQLRVWFNDGVNGLQQVSPDQRIASVGYALMAANVSVGAITSDKIAAGSVGSAHLANGAVGSLQLAVGAVTGTAIATGAVTTASIAYGAVDSLQLAKPPRSGSIPSSALSIMFNYATTNITFDVPFNTKPMVTLALETSDASIADFSTLGLQSRTNTGFTVRWRNSTLPVTLDSSGDVGWDTSLAYLGTGGSRFPAISYRYRTDGDLKFIASMTMNGEGWYAPVNVTTNGNVGSSSSLLWLPSYNAPCISYYDIDNYDLKFVRANTSNGSSWGTPVTVDALNDVGSLHSLILLPNNYPAIAYFDGNYGDLKFVRANDPGGNSWLSPVYVDATPTVFVSAPVSAAIVSGNPAILYRNQNNNNLLYIRAGDAVGSTWGTATVVATGTFASLSIVNGRPAFCYNNGSALYYQRAADPTGATWNVAIALDTVNVATSRSLQLAVVGGKPAVSYYDNTNGDLKYVFAQDADGTAWNTPVTVDSNGKVGQYNSLAEVNGSPAISYSDATNGDLKFVRHRSPAIFTINWIALEP